MKAQSELAGDRERVAEMTAPRTICGATTWIASVSGDIERFNEYIEKSGLTPEKLAEILRLASMTPSTLPNEVKSPCRSVTAGLHSVNSVKICQPSRIAVRGGYLFMRFRQFAKNRHCDFHVVVCVNSV